MRTFGWLIVGTLFCTPVLGADEPPKEQPRVQTVHRVPPLPSIVLPLTSTGAAEAPADAVKPAAPARPLPVLREPDPPQASTGAEPIQAPEPLVDPSAAPLPAADSPVPAEAPGTTAAPAAATPEASIATEPAAPKGGWPSESPLRIHAEVSPEPAASAAAIPPAELVAQLLTPRPNTVAAGASVDLQRVLTGAISPPERREALAAYWSLVEALAGYHAAYDYAASVQRVPSSTVAGDEALRRTALAASAADVQQAALRLSDAQYQLVQWLRVASDAPLPLPADEPYVGAYRTSFEEVYRGRSDSWRARGIDRTLPARRLAIEAHAAAVTAAREARTATLAAYEAGKAPVADVLASAEEVRRCEVAFMAAACQYNRETSEYALSAAPASVGPQELAVRIVVPKSRPLTPSEGTVMQASGTEPASSSGWQPTAQTPTPASPTEPPVSPPATLAEDALTAGSALPSASREPAAAAPPADQQPPAEDSPVPSAGQPALQTRQRPATGLYPALIDVEPVRQAHELATALTAGASASKAVSGRPLALVDALSGRSGDRLSLVRAYWTAARRLAEYEAIAQEQGMLEALAFSQESAPAGAEGEEAGLQLSAARAANEAALHDARVRLIEAQHELAGLAGWDPTASQWPLPATSPHCGEYLLKFEKQRPEAVQSWTVRRLASSVPAQHATLARQAAAVVEADAARAELTAERDAGTTSTLAVLQAIQRQTHETRAFLEMLADYNISIAEYVVQVVPDTFPADRLAAALVTSGR